MPFNPQMSVRIAAPISTVWTVLTDFDAYPQWNPDVLFHSPPVEGESVKITVRLFGRSLTVPVLILVVEPERELCWRGGSSWLMTGKHYFKLEPAGDAETLLVHGERFEGSGIPLLRPLIGRELAAFYERINVALKTRCEAQFARDDSTIA